MGGKQSLEERRFAGAGGARDDNGGFGNYRKVSEIFPQLLRVESSRVGERTGSHFLLNGYRNWGLKLWRSRVLCETVYQFTELRSAGCGAAQAQHT